MSTATTSLRLNHLRRRQMSAIKRKAEQLGVTIEEYVKELIEEDLSLDRTAQSTSLDQLAQPFEKAMAELSDQELGRRVEAARARFRKRSGGRGR